MVRIAFIGPMLGVNPGRVPDPAEELARRLRQAGHQCYTFSPVENRYLRFADILRSILSYHSRFDVICLQVYGGPSFVVEDTVSWLALRLNKKLVMALHGGALPRFLSRHRSWAKRVLRRAHILATPSRYLAGELWQLGFDCTVIPNALDLSQYPYRHRQKASPRLAWLRAFHRIYSPADAVLALAELAPQFPDIHLSMIGPDLGDGAFQTAAEVIRRQRLQDRVTVLGPIPKAQVADVLSAHDILLNTTRYESFGIGVMEAAALGMAIVTTAVGELPYLWQDQVNALLVPPGRPDLLASAVRRLLTEPELTARLSKNARARAEQFAWERILPQWEELFQRLEAG